MAQQRSNHQRKMRIQMTANQVLNQLANMFPGQGLPQAILTSQTNNFLTAATTSQADQNNFRVLYYAEKSDSSE